MADSSHLLDQNPKIRAGQITNKKNRHSKIRKVVERLKHACECTDSNCTSVDCEEMKSTVVHFKMCTRQSKKNCKACRQLLALSRYHATRTQDCESSHCLIPCCAKIKHVLKLKENVASGIQPGGDNVFCAQVSYSAGGISQLQCSTPASANTQERWDNFIPNTVPSSLPPLRPLYPAMNTGANLLPLQEFQQRRPEESHGIRQLTPQTIQGPMGPMGSIDSTSQIGPSMGQLVPSMGPLSIGQIQPGINLPNPQNTQRKEALQQLMQVVREPQSLEQQQQILAILKANPQLMAAFIKQRQAQQRLNMTPSQRPMVMCSYQMDIENDNRSLPQLKMLLHAQNCLREETEGVASWPCFEANCGLMKNCLKHVRDCSKERDCNFIDCGFTKSLIRHWGSCRNTQCRLCREVRQLTRGNNQAPFPEVPFPELPLPFGTIMP